MLDSKILVAQPMRQGLKWLGSSRQGRSLMQLAEEHDWPFQVIGRAPAPTRTVSIPNWRLVPIADEKGEIPTRALQRVQAIYAAGIRPKAFIIAHELSPEIQTQEEPTFRQQLEPYVGQALQFTIKAARVTGHVLSTYVLPAVGEALAIAIPLIVMAMVAGIAYDPCLIVVTEDNVWIQIDSWLA